MFCVCVVPMDSLNGELLFHYTIPNEIVLMHTVLKVLFVWSLGGLLCWMLMKTRVLTTKVSV